ncbi:TNF receptor-associated factor 6-like [Amblyomma americanum]
MPPAIQQYTLVGFSPELDWRPLTFLKPFPANRACSACGLVRKKTALLPCMHVLCECCYEQCGQDGSNECPLDGNRYEKEDVGVLDFTADDLLRREVKCWNEGSGCEYATAASRISQHFLLECEHHSVRCPRCSATVLRRHVCTHLRSASCNTSTPVASESQVQASEVDGAALLTSFRGALESQAAEIAAYLRPMSVDIGTHWDRLSEFSRSINTLEETLRQKTEFLTKQNDDEMALSHAERAELRERIVTCSETVSTSFGILEETLKDKLGGIGADLSQIAASIEQVKTEWKESVQKSLQAVTNGRRESALQVRQCEFFIRGVKSLQEEAMEKGKTDYHSEKVYLCGYCMSPGVTFAMQGTSAHLWMKYSLHKGDTDDDVQWPFEHEMRMSVIHPEENAYHVLELESYPDDPANQRPATSSYSPMYFEECFYLEDLIRRGYVDNDQLRIKWELLP